MSTHLDTYTALSQHYNVISPPPKPPTLLEDACALVELARERGPLPLQGPWRLHTSVCRELAIHVSKRTALGCALLALAFENSAALKAAALDALGKKEVTSYKADGALDQLIAIDAAYLGVIAVANFFFPYVLPCTFFNPVQLLIPPNDPAGFPTGAIEKA